MDDIYYSQLRPAFIIAASYISGKTKAHTFRTPNSPPYSMLSCSNIVLKSPIINKKYTKNDIHNYPPKWGKSGRRVGNCGHS